MDSYARLLAFAAALDEHRVPYRVSVDRPEAVRITIALPMQIWEYEFMKDGGIEVQRFVGGEVEPSQDPLAEVLKAWRD